MTKRIKYVNNKTKMLLIQYITGFVAFFLILLMSWLVVEKWQLIPSWLDYQPFNCKKCLGFWTGIACGTAFCIGGWWISGICLFFLSMLNAGAVIIDERNNGFKL